MNTKLIPLIVLAVALLAGCGGAITEKRAKLATTQPTPEALATATPQPDQNQDTPPQPVSAGQLEADGLERGGMLDTFAAVSVGLLFLAICGGAVYLYASGVGAAIIRRNSHLFTTGGNNQ